VRPRGRPARNPARGGRTRSLTSRTPWRSPPGNGWHTSTGQTPRKRWDGPRESLRPQGRCAAHGGGRGEGLEGEQSPWKDNVREEGRQRSTERAGLTGPSNASKPSKRHGGNGRGDAVRRAQGPHPTRASGWEAGSSRGVKATLRESRRCPTPGAPLGNQRGGRRGAQVETSEVMPVPGAKAWEPARGVNRRGGDRTTRAEHDGSGGTDLPKGATPGVDARR